MCRFDNVVAYLCRWAKKVLGTVVLVKSRVLWTAVLRDLAGDAPQLSHLGKGVVEQTGASKGLQSVWAGCCENHSVGVFDLSHGTVMAAGYQTPKHNRRTDRGTITRAAWIKLWTQAEAAGKRARQLTGVHVSFG